MVKYSQLQNCHLVQVKVIQVVSTQVLQPTQLRASLAQLMESLATNPIDGAARRLSCSLSKSIFHFFKFLNSVIDDKEVGRWLNLGNSTCCAFTVLEMLCWTLTKRLNQMSNQAIQYCLKCGLLQYEIRVQFLCN